MPPERRRLRPVTSQPAHPVQNRILLLTAVLATALLSVSSCSDAAGPGGPATKLTRVTAHEQTGSVGSTLGAPLTVRVTDRAGRAVAGMTVSWSVTAGGGSLAATTSTTDDAGHASTLWTLGTIAGEQSATASVESAGSVTFTAIATPGPAVAIEKVAGDAQEQAAGMMLPVPLEVRVSDAWGNRVPGVLVAWSVSGGGVVEPSSSATGSDGHASARLRLSAAPGANTVTASISAAATTTFSASAIFDRMDRADDISGPQVHIVYVVPADGTDRELDRNGTLVRSITSFHNWFRLQTDGYEIRFDTHQGELDITFFRLARPDAEIMSHGAFVVTQVEAELTTAGRIRDDKLYLIYYDGGSSWSCGGAAWPPNVPGRAAAMYLRGTPPGASCGNVAFVNSATDFPGYWEFAALHDLIHTLGIVSPEAPNHTFAYPAHVPDRNDLMYSGPQPWIINTTTVIDVDGDDYFGPNVAAGIPNLAASPYLRRATLATLLAARINAPAPADLALLNEQLRMLPLHEWRTEKRETR